MGKALGHNASDSSLRILVSGGTGFIGSALVSMLRGQGHHLSILSRHDGEGHIVWDPQSKVIDQAALEGFDAVIHLAGESIAGRWTETKKRRIYESRVSGTQFLCEVLSRLAHKPRVLVSVSGISASVGAGFLAQVGYEWEAATRSARNVGIRVFLPRVSVVLSSTGGALRSMLPIFRLGLGGPMGGGRQHISWVALGDLINILYEAVLNDAYRGCVDILAPEVVTNSEFARKLAQYLHRPGILPIPAFILRLCLGEVVDETILADVQGNTGALDALGYRFEYPTLESAFRHLIS